MSDVIQADYEKLEQIAARFEALGTNTHFTAADIEFSFLDVKHSWQGKGSEAFTAEMEGVVMPAVDRLAEAFYQASDVVMKIIDVVKAAEEEASAPFRGGAAAGGVATGVAAGSVAGAAAGSAAAAGGSASGSGGGGSESPWYIRAAKAGKEVVQRAFQVRGIVKGLQNLKSFSDVVNNFSKPLTGFSKLGPVLGVAGGVLSTGIDINERLANGEDFASALSKEAGEGTFETVARLALYSNPYTGIPTLANDVLAYFTDGETDVLDMAGQYVGAAADRASDWTADNLIAPAHKYGKRAVNAIGSVAEDGYDLVAGGLDDLGDGFSDGVSAVGDFLGF